MNDFFVPFIKSKWYLLRSNKGNCLCMIKHSVKIQAQRPQHQAILSGIFGRKKIISGKFGIF